MADAVGVVEVQAPISAANAPLRLRCSAAAVAPSAEVVSLLRLADVALSLAWEPV